MERGYLLQEYMTRDHIVINKYRLFRFAAHTVPNGAILRAAVLTDASSGPNGPLGEVAEALARSASPVTPGRGPKYPHV